MCFTQNGFHVSGPERHRNHAQKMQLHDEHANITEPLPQKQNDLQEHTHTNILIQAQMQSVPVCEKVIQCIS